MPGITYLLFGYDILEHLKEFLIEHWIKANRLIEVHKIYW